MFKDGKKALLDLLKEPLLLHGFEHLKDLSFGRSRRDGMELLSFSARRGTAGEFCFSFGAGVRFKKLEALLRPDAEDDLMPTISKPLSVLKEGPGFPEWCFDGQAKPEDIVNQVLADIGRHALPFLERYSSLAEVQEALSQEDPRQWFVFTPEQRLATLAAIEHLEGRTADAVHRLDTGLQALEAAPLKKRWALQKLRERLKT